MSGFLENKYEKIADKIVTSFYFCFPKDKKTRQIENKDKYETDKKAFPDKFTTHVKCQLR